jgi:Leu/Phe-tRNA-protein transferase
MRRKTRYPLRYTVDGYVFIDSTDDLDLLVDALISTDYNMEFCFALDWDASFVADLMSAGFLVMSTRFADKPDESLMLPKLHLVRSALFFPNLHIKKSIRRFLGRYELRVDTDFDAIVDKCVKTHGGDWLTQPLVDTLTNLHNAPKKRSVRPISFGVYRDGLLRAGEFGILSGSVYTSYSGYFDEANAGTAQMILMAKYLESCGSPFLDLGMPLPYKYDLGAEDIVPQRFVEIFRQGRKQQLGNRVRQ